MLPLLAGAEAGVLPPFALADALRAGVSFLLAEAFLPFGVRGPFGVLLADALRGVFVVEGFLFAFGVVGVSFSSASGGFAMSVYLPVSASISAQVQISMAM